MCLYMSVPRWISLERFAGAVYDSASHLIEVSVVLFLLNCHNDKSTSAATTATRSKSADALTATATATATRAAANASAEAAIVGGESTSVVLCAGDIADKLMPTKVSAPTISHTVVLEQPRV